MPFRDLKRLLMDPVARKRWSTWQPVAIILAIVAGLAYVQFHVFPAQDSKANQAVEQARSATKTANAAHNAADAAREACLDIRQKQIDANRELRVPLHKFSEKSAHAWDVIYKLFASSPAPEDQTNEQSLNRARFLLALNEAYTAAQELEKTVKRVEPVVCDA
jgi:hypothetical protein